MKLDKKRRRECKTNYKKRLKLLEGMCLRLVIRKTNRYIILQIVESRNAQDKVVNGVTTKELLNYGWPESKKGSLKSLTAAYLGGILLGKKAKSTKVKLILDLGITPNTKESRIYSAMKGISDSGIKIDYNEKIIPKKERIENTKIIDSTVFEKIKSKISGEK